MSKRYLDLKPMQDDILKKLEETFLATEYLNTDTIEVKVKLDDIMPKEETEEPKIYILDTVWLKIQTLVEHNSKEVAWHCLVNRTENTFVIYDILVFPQHVTSVTAVGIDNEYEMWIATLPDEQFDYLRCHMHSHVNMGVTPSGTDETYYANLMTDVKDFYITMIINKSHTYTLRLYDKTTNLMWSDLKFEVCNSEGSTYSTWLDEVQVNVKDEPVRTYKAPSKYAYTGKQSSFNWKNADEIDDYYSAYYGIGKSNKKKEADVVVVSPDNSMHVFEDNNEATKFVLDYYKDVGIKDYNQINNHNIMQCIKGRDMFVIDKTTHEVIDYVVSVTQFPKAQYDLWEVAES